MSSNKYESSAPVDNLDHHSPPSRSFRAVVQCILALQRLQGGLNPAVSYAERSASRQPTARWVKKSNSGKDQQVPEEGAGQDSNRAARQLTHSGSFGSRGQRRADLIFHPLPPSSSNERLDAAAADHSRPVTHVSAQA